MKRCLGIRKFTAVILICAILGMPTPSRASFGDDVLAPFVGGAVGLGLGHTIKGVYFDTGFKFTLLDIGAATFVMTSMVDCILESATECEKMSFAVTALFAIRIWEVVSVIRTEPGKSAMLFPVPLGNSLGLALRYQF